MERNDVLRIEGDTDQQIVANLLAGIAKQPTPEDDDES